MNLTRWEDWYSEAFRAVDELRRRCSSVFVMGLSMGGALTLRIAENEGDTLTGIVLVNPAVHSERPDRHALPLLRHIVPSFPGISNDINKPGQDEIAYDKIPLKAAHSMTRLWGAVKTDIGRVRQPLLLFRSSDDHVVEPSNARWILDNVSSTDTREIVLERSAHVATLDYDAGIIEQESIDFVRRLRS
jgi:carboxylesterase